MLSTRGNKGQGEGLGNANVQLAASQDTGAWVQEREKVRDKLHIVSNPDFSSSPEGQ